MANELPTYDFASYPDKGFIQKKEFEDPADADGTLIHEYETLLYNGSLASAKKILDDNPDLAKKMFGTEDINKLYEETRNTEIVATQEKQSIYYKVKPVTCKAGDIFIGEEQEG